MALLDILLTAAGTGIVSFLIGVILRDNIKEILFYKYLMAPVELSHGFIFYHFMHNGIISTGVPFYDEISVINNSNSTIKIDQLECAMITSDYPPGIGVFWANNFENLHKMMYSGGMIGGISISGGTFPIVLKPKESRAIWFGLKAEKNESTARRFNVIITPVYKYKKPKLEYNFEFRSN